MHTCTCGTPSHAQAAVELDGAVTLPGSREGGAEVLVGTLDLNFGAVLPSEELVGALPSTSGSGGGAGPAGDGLRVHMGRAYLSNVCVARAARRMGVAQLLMHAAEKEARAQGASHLYVHVVRACAFHGYWRAGLRGAGSEPH
jgi:ribosomal protein S18 acetylase RimI-like enzyme